jgi:WD40 repeat protein
MILTGGWDNTVQFWDLRVGAAVRSFYGPHICGDSLDICGMYMYVYLDIDVYANTIHIFLFVYIFILSVHIY